MLAIGTIRLPLPFMLAPMAGITDLPFRLVTRPFGCQLAFTEMVDATALVRRDRRTRHMVASVPEDRPLGIQLLGNNAEHLAEALELLRPHRFDLIDFNAACPAPKVTRKGKGAALLRAPEALGRLLRVLVDGAGVPVTVKIRTGWDDASVNAGEIAAIAEQAGVSAIVIHGRTKVQGYGGTVDYRIIEGVRKAVRIPVIASGDNLSIPLVQRMFDETGCDGVAVARGALGNPWIFPDLHRLFRGQEPLGMPGPPARVAVMKEHLHLLTSYWGERRGVACFHKFFVWYTRGLPEMRALRDRAFRTGSLAELTEVFDDLAGRPSPDS